MLNFIEIIDPEERFSVRLKGYEGTTFFMRRMDAATEKRLEAGVPPLPESPTPEEIGRRQVDIFDAKFDYVLVDWEGVNHPVSKEPVPCTPEMKRRLPTRVQLELSHRANTAGAAVSDEEQGN